jgi:hypothetical protein
MFVSEWAFILCLFRVCQPSLKLSTLLRSRSQRGERGQRRRYFHICWQIIQFLTLKQQRQSEAEEANFHRSKKSELSFGKWQNQLTTNILEIGCTCDWYNKKREQI